MRITITVKYILDEERRGDALALVSALAEHELVVPISDHEVEGIGGVGVVGVQVSGPARPYDEEGAYRLDPETIDAEAQWMLRKIHTWIGYHPNSFIGWDGTFSGLHDFVDANDFLPPLRSGPYKGEALIDESIDPVAFERSLARANAIIEKVEKLLAQRKHARGRTNEAPRRRVR